VEHTYQTRRPRIWPSFPGIAEDRASGALARLENFTRLVSDMIWEADQHGVLTFVSERAMDIFGVPASHLVGQKITNIGTFFAPEGHRQSPNTERPFRDHKCTIKRPDGRTRILFVSALPHYNELSWEISGLHGTVKDVTPKFEVERLKAAKDLAETDSHVKSEILATTSHELRTPLNAIIGFSSLIQDETFGPLNNPAYMDYIGNIKDSGEHLLSIINDILDTAALQSTQATLCPSTFRLIDVMQSALRLVQPHAEKDDISLSCVCAEHDVHLLADKRRMKQIFLNLLSNAVKFTARGGRVTIDFSHPPGAGLTIAVTDTGIGMDPNDIKKAMTPFGQINTDTDQAAKGTGLGLPLTQELVELHGGTLEVLSQKGTGTTVNVHLPENRIAADAAR